RRRHSPVRTPPSASTNPQAAAAAVAAGREGRDGGLRRPRHRGPTRLLPPPGPPPGHRRRRSLVSASHAWARPRPAAQPPFRSGSRAAIGQEALGARAADLAPAGPETTIG
ncbi:Hypothetical predicted protein, partial [Marmota monax]